MPDLENTIPVSESIEALQWLALFGTPSQRIAAKKALEGYAPAGLPVLPRAASDPPPAIIRGKARYRGNFGSYEEAKDYIIDSGIPLEYTYLDADGNLWVIS